MKVKCPHCGLEIRRELSYYFGFSTIDGKCSQRCNRCMQPYLVHAWTGETCTLDEGDNQECALPEPGGTSTGLRSSAPAVTTGSSAPRHGSDDGDESS